MDAAVASEMAARNESEYLRISGRPGVSVRRDSLILKTEQRLPKPLMEIASVFRCEARDLVEIGGFLKPVLREQFKYFFRHLIKCFTPRRARKQTRGSGLLQTSFYRRARSIPKSTVVSQNSRPTVMKNLRRPASPTEPPTEMEPRGVAATNPAVPSWRRMALAVGDQISPAS